VPKESQKPLRQHSPSPKAPANASGLKRPLPLFSEDKDETPKRSKKAKKAAVVSEEERTPSPTIKAPSPSPEIQLVESTSGKRQKGKNVSAIAKLDMPPQDISKHGYLEDAFLLNSMIYLGVH
jgi:hypothetical protein